MWEWSDVWVIYFYSSLIAAKTSSEIHRQATYLDDKYA